MNNEKKFFDEMALKWRSQAILVPGATQFRNMLLDKAMKRALIPILKSYHNMHILEVGCGVGRWVRIMSIKNSVIGVDVSRFMIKMAKDSCKAENCSFIVADISFLPFKKNVFDLVISITVLQHILEAKKFARALSEIARCSKSEVLIVEEMWSDKEILLEKVYCPIRILPVESYVKGLLIARLHSLSLGGVTFAPLAVFLTRLFGSGVKLLKDSAIYKLKTSKVISKVSHFAMGVGTLSAVFMPRGIYNPRFSLHTIIHAMKKKLKDNL